MTALYAALFSAQAPVEDAFSPPALPEAEIRDRLARGVPALAPEAFRADPQALRQLWEEVCAIAARHLPDLAPALEPIRRWPDGREERYG